MSWAETQSVPEGGPYAIFPECEIIIDESDDDDLISADEISAYNRGLMNRIIEETIHKEGTSSQRQNPSSDRYGFQISPARRIQVIHYASFRLWRIERPDSQ